MVFGMIGRTAKGWLAIFVVAMAGLVSAQTDPGRGLPMVVPAASEVAVELGSTVRGPGLKLTWPEPPDSVSTIVSLVDTAGLGITMTVAGDYADRFDRTLDFIFQNSGSVGSDDQNRLLCIWANANSEWTGRLGGAINLSNTGGLWVQDAGGWSQRNLGLPRFLPYANLLDMDRADDGTLVVFIAAGSPFQVNSEPIGLFRTTAMGEWEEIGAEFFGSNYRVTKVAIDPADSRSIAVGTLSRGVFLTRDGGATFTPWTTDVELEPGNPIFEITAMHWTSERLYVGWRNVGLLVSEDGSDEFRRLALEVPLAPGDETRIWPQVNVVVEDASDPQRILAGLSNHGVWESRDGGEQWDSILIDYDDDTNPNWIVSVSSLHIDPNDGDRVAAGTVRQLIRRTADGGANWTQAITPFDAAGVKPRIWSMIGHGGRLLAQAADQGLMESLDLGATWTMVADQPYNRLARDLVSDGTTLYLPTTGGGMYQANTPVLLTDTLLLSATDADLRGIDLGLTIAFGPGTVTLQDTNGDGVVDPRRVRLICQDFQGWIVWRAPRGAPDEMMMIGRYDKNNPETCIEGYCGDDNYFQLPNCFSERRAACFAFPEPGYVSFYDDDVFNGFTYHYAVTPFDFGDISRVSDPQSIASPMTFPRRYPGDELGQGAGLGNRFEVQVNEDAAPALDGETIYAYPNPLRLGTGIVGGEGEEVIWTNLPPNSRIQIFTLAGDEIAELPRDGRPQEGANMYWVTRNDDNRLLASGIYIWRAIMPERGDFWGKLVIIN